MATLSLSSAQEPPNALRRRLRPGESVIWWSHGSGRIIDLSGTVWALLTITTIAILAMVMAFGGISLTAADLADPRLPLYLFVVVLPLLFALFRAFYWSRLEVYALTPRRVMCIPLGISLFARSVRNSDIDAAEFGSDREAAIFILRHAPIRKIRITGNRQTGSVQLRSMGDRDHPAGDSMSLTGIERPLEIAALIKSTLKLDLPIEDLTR